MPDQIEGVETTVDETTETVPQVEETQEIENQTQESVSGDEIPDEYPEDEQKRREAFIKMRQALKAQKSQSHEEDSGLSVLNELRKGSNPQIDPITPDTDITQVTARMTMAERMAYEARQDAQQAKIELENQRLYRVAPELDPESADFQKPETKLLDKYIAGQIMLAKAQGKSYDIVKLAKQAKVEFTGMTQSQKLAAADEAVQKMQKKDQASLEAKGNSVSIPKAQNVESLRERMRRGDNDARTEFIKTLLPDDI